MRHLRVKLLSTSWSWLLLAALMVPVSIQAQTWQAAVGAQSVDKAKQVVAFLPNEIWIHAGDTVNWTVGADEIHTITFLTVGQVHLPFFVGCPGFSFGAASFDGSTCVSTPPMVSGQTFNVMFPTPGRIIWCLLASSTRTIPTSEQCESGLSVSPGGARSRSPTSSPETRSRDSWLQLTQSSCPFVTVAVCGTRPSKRRRYRVRLCSRRPANGRGSIPRPTFIFRNLETSRTCDQRFASMSVVGIPLQ